MLTFVSVQICLAITCCIQLNGFICNFSKGISLDSNDYIFVIFNQFLQVWYKNEETSTCSSRYVLLCLIWNISVKIGLFICAQELLFLLSILYRILSFDWYRLGHWFCCTWILLFANYIKSDYFTRKSSSDFWLFSGNSHSSLAVRPACHTLNTWMSWISSQFSVAKFHT